MRNEVFAQYVPEEGWAATKVADWQLPEGIVHVQAFLKRGIVYTSIVYMSPAQNGIRLYTSSERPLRMKFPGHIHHVQ